MRNFFEKEERKYSIEDINIENIFSDKNNNIYKFILIDTSANFFIIKAINQIIFMEEEIEKDKINIEIFPINKKQVEKYILLIDGIILTYSSKDKEIINNIMDFIYKINKKIKKEKFFPKIILGDKKSFQNYINNIKNTDKKEFNKIKNIFINYLYNITKINKYLLFLNINP